MKISRKLELARQHIESISRHDDADEKTVHAALDQLIAHCEAEKLAHTDRKAVVRAKELGSDSANA